MKQVLLFQRRGVGRERRPAFLNRLGVEVTTVEPDHIHWAKLVERGGWGAVLIDADSLDTVPVELVSELTLAGLGSPPPILVLLGDAEPATRLEGIVYIKGDSELAEHLRCNLRDE